MTYSIYIAHEDRRLRFGANLLLSALTEVGVNAEIKVGDTSQVSDCIFIAVRGESEAIDALEAADMLLYHAGDVIGEAYCVETLAGNALAVVGGSRNGALYGCLALTNRIREERGVPSEALMYDCPRMRLRGPCIGLQKTELEPPRRTYEYPITPKRFPWFYDRELWLTFLNQMLDDRCNVLYIWSGHPFSSLVRLDEFPEALEVTPEELANNRDTFMWLAQKCDERGIWLVMKFYNIHIPLPFAQAHKLSLIQNDIHPLVEKYTRAAIAAFVEAYPNVGLMVCLGEALRGVDNKAKWFSDTIVPAVREGANRAGLKEEPPIILRGHDCDPVLAMKGLKGGYDNLYTMWKYNGEGLTTRLPRGKWQQMHQSMNELGKAHIMNIHILSNLEPFRYIAPTFIQDCVQASIYRLGGGGLHLYPLFYWDWPLSPDKASPRLLQPERDRLWFKAWFRYAWNPDRPADAEKLYWQREFQAHFQLPQKQADALLEACELTGLLAPKLLARFGITEGNRQTMSLGMTMSELTNAARYRPNGELYASVARAGETLEVYAQKEANGEAHTGETPPLLLEKLESILSRIEALTSGLTVNGGEAARMLSDIRATELLSRCYIQKVRAAMLILKYKYSMDAACAGDIQLLEEALQHMRAAQEKYSALASYTDETYLFANSMQTPQRKIPFPDGGKYRHWRDCLPMYESELRAYEKRLEMMRRGWLPVPPSAGDAERTAEAQFTVLSGGEKYTLCEGAAAFTDKQSEIESCCAEVCGLTGVRFKISDAIVSGIRLKLKLSEKSRILIGYIEDKGVEWLEPPKLETDTHADDRGGYAAVYSHAIKVKGIKPINIHAFLYDEGECALSFPTGAFMLVGVVPANAVLTPRDAGLGGESLSSLDWLYEEDN